MPIGIDEPGDGILQIKGDGGVIAGVDSDGNFCVKIVDETVKTDDSAVQARRTTTIDYVLTTYTDVDFDATDIEIDSTKIDHDNVTNTDRITVKETGLYEIHYALPSQEFVKGSSCTYTLDARVRLNDTSVLVGSEDDAGNEFGSTGGADEPNTASATFLASLTADDFLTVQARYVDNEGTCDPRSTKDPIFTVKRLRGTKGAKGDTGATGSGSTLITKDEGIALANSPNSEYNFIGAGVTVTPGAGGIADITIPNASAVFGTEFQYEESLPESTTTSSTYQNKLALTTPSIPAGDYKISWSFDLQGTDKDSDAQARVQLDNTTDIEEILLDSGKIKDQYLNWTGMSRITLTAAVHTIDIDFSTVSASKTVKIENARLEIFRVT